MTDISPFYTVNETIDEFVLHMHMSDHECYNSRVCVVKAADANKRINKSKCIAIDSLKYDQHDNVVHVKTSLNTTTTFQQVGQQLEKIKAEHHGDAELVFVDIDNRKVIDTFVDRDNKVVVVVE